MRNLVITVASEFCFAHSMLNLSYDLGHTVYVSGRLSSALIEITTDLQIIQLEDSTDKRVDLYVSAAGVTPAVENGVHLVLSVSTFPGVHNYEVSWMQCVGNAYVTIETLRLNIGHLINGADIYNEISLAAIHSFRAVISLFAQDVVKNTDNLILNKTLPAQVDLQEVRSWHKSNESYIDVGTVPTSIFTAFESSVLLNSNKCAITFEQEDISYSQLHRLSLKFANVLQQKIDFSNDEEPPIVALALHKSIELYAAILGVLAVGATYVPIDPEYPEERIANIVKSAKPVLLVIDVNANVEMGDFKAVLDIAEVNLHIDVEPSLITRNVDCNSLEKAAVIIYTSGSTGTPKGVQLSHKNILYFSDWYKHHVLLNKNSKALQFTTVSFDASLLDIFPTLLVGAQLIVPNNEQRHDFDELNSLIISSKATHSFIPPAMLGALPDYEWPSMAHIVTGGDVCDASTIERWSKNRALHNIYGPTECTVLATTERFIENSNNKIIGKPISNTRVYLLNEEFEPVATDEHGELYISGFGVGLGYYDAPDLTQERFISDPFNHNQLMYKTGDICYWDRIGRINFIGRKDNQLKIRGFRVELGEIENVILASGLYKKCTVVANEKMQIRAFVAQPKNNSSITALEAVLEKTLPYYMLPSDILELDEFPSTTNGKIDRAKLLAIPNPTELQHAEILNETETSLRTIWAQALDMDKSYISKKDSFFDLGGHSLLVSKMLLSVKSNFQGSFTLARFMENPTIEGLSSLLTDGELQKGDQISERIYSDMVLDDVIRPVAEINKYAFSPKAVLLTGANGFLGVHILDELIKQTDAIIYCLIRASSEEYAYKKLNDACQKYGVKELTGNARIKTLLGDLDEPQIGLSDALFSHLAEEVDVIYHNGAQVNHIYDYDYLRNSNVRSTLDLLRLATTTKNKQFIFTSTLSAASNINSDGRLVEDGPSENLPVFVNNGYNLTKWVSEQLIWQAHNRGLAVTLVRPGNICGHSKTGYCYPDKNRILLLLKGSVQLGYAPDWDTNFDLCPVDFIAKGVVAASVQQLNHAPVLHFHNPMPLKWTEYVGRLNFHHVPIKLIPAKQWQSMLFTLDENNALFNVVSFYIDDENEDIGDISNIDYHLTLARLQQFGMRYPEKDNSLVDANLGFLINSGFIKPSFVKHKTTTKFAL